MTEYAIEYHSQSKMYTFTLFMDNAIIRYISINEI